MPLMRVVSYGKVIAGMVVTVVIVMVVTNLGFVTVV